MSARFHRRAKATRLLAVIRLAADVTADEAAAWGNATWEILRQTAGVPPPSEGDKKLGVSLETRKLVIAGLRGREEKRSA